MKKRHRENKALYKKQQNDHKKQLKALQKIVRICTKERDKVEKALGEAALKREDELRETRADRAKAEKKQQAEEKQEQKVFIWIGDPDCVLVREGQCDDVMFFCVPDNNSTYCHRACSCVALLNLVVLAVCQRMINFKTSG